MTTSDFLALLNAPAEAVLANSSGRPEIRHFGNLPAELAALEGASVVVPLSGFSRLRVTGGDRARFLHNFCTNDINGLETGTFREAFFTDVKARVLAHGYILAGDDHHEIWMLPGDEERLVSHLTRYVITEDVDITSQSDSGQVFALLGPQVPDVLHAAEITDGSWTTGTVMHRMREQVLMAEWNQQPAAFVVADGESAHGVWKRLIDHSTAAGTIAFHHQRICEGFPVIGVDTNETSLAPEIHRNDQAISYTKGCYLGQEPIARIDALGHVNRRLYRAVVTSAIEAPDSTALPPPCATSWSEARETNRPILGVFRVADVDASPNDFQVMLPDGSAAVATVPQ